MISCRLGIARASRAHFGAPAEMPGSHGNEKVLDGEGAIDSTRRRVRSPEAAMKINR
jgi:hypothetical protein